MDFILIRHGQSAANKKGLLIADAADDLTELGRIQSQALAKLIAAEIGHPTHLYVSPWARAKSTAEIVFSSCLDKMTTDGRIGETFPGKHGSWLEADFNRTYPDFYKDLSRRYDGGESHKDMSMRVVSWLEETVIPRAAEDGCLVCVTHGGPISVILQHLMGIPFDSHYPSFTVPNASYTKLVWRKDLNRFCAMCVGVAAPLS